MRDLVPPDRADRPPIGLLVAGLVGMTVLGVLLSRRERLPAIPVIGDELLQTVAHLVLAATLTLVVVTLIGRFRPRWAVLGGFAIIALFTTTVELAQIPLPDRSADVRDATANIFGAAIGAGAAVALRRVDRSVAGRVVTAAVLVVTTGQAWAFVAGITPNRSCGSEVQAGVTSPLPAGPESVATSYRYDMSVGAEDGDEFVVDEVGGGPELRSADPVELRWRDDGLVIGAGDSGDGKWDPLQSAVAGQQLSAAVAGAGSVHAEVVVTPDGFTRGPARIVAISKGSTAVEANFHIGQHGDELSVRLRLECGLVNWTRIEGVFTAGQSRHIVVTYGESIQRIWVDGTLLEQRAFDGDTATTNWDPSMSLVIGNSPGGDRPFFGSVDQVTIGTG